MTYVTVRIACFIFENCGILMEYWSTFRGTFMVSQTTNVALDEVSWFLPHSHLALMFWTAECHSKVRSPTEPTVGTR